MIAGFDLKEFAKKVVGGALGGFISEVLVTKLPFSLGEWTTPVLGTVVGLGGQYLRKKGMIDKDIADILEFAGATTVGNWIWEMVKGKMGLGAQTYSSTGVAQEIIYVPPIEKEKKLEEQAITVI